MTVRLGDTCPLCGFVLVFAALAGGCNREDTERMARLGRKVAARAEAVSTDQIVDLNKGWQAVQNGWQEATLAGRVSARLHGTRSWPTCRFRPRRRALSSS